MPDGLGVHRVSALAAFLRGLEEIGANTGITLAVHGPVALRVERDGPAEGDDGGSVWEIESYVDTDRVIRYRVQPQPQ